MLPQRESLPAVTAAGVIAIVFGVLGTLFGILVQVSLLIIPNIESARGSAAMPAASRAAASIIWLFLLAIAIAQIFVGAAVLRRRNWARITILIWAGIMAFFSAFSAVAVFFVFSLMPQAMPNVPDASSVMSFMKVFMLLFYGIPFGVAVWWLILFTRPRVAAAFKTPSASWQTPLPLDASGFPHQPTPSLAPVKQKPSCPLPLAILAGFLLCSAVTLPLLLLLPTTSSTPFFLFGHIFRGSSVQLFFVALGLLYGVTAIGMLRLKAWGLDTILGVQIVFLLNGIASAASPNFLLAMHESMEKLRELNPALPPNFPFFSDSVMRAFLFLGLITSLGVIGLLVAYRSRFLKAAAEAAR